MTRRIEIGRVACSHVANGTTCRMSICGDISSPMGRLAEYRVVIFKQSLQLLYRLWLHSFWAVDLVEYCPIPFFFVARAIARAILIHRRCDRLVLIFTGANAALRWIIYYCTDVRLCATSLFAAMFVAVYFCIFSLKTRFCTYLRIHLK